MTTGNLNWTQLASSSRHGTGSKGPSSDGTGTAGNIPIFNGSGDLTDGAPPPTAITETPSGTLNGVNVTFTISHTPIAGTFRLLLNGVEQEETRWYSRSTTTITYTVAPKSRDRHTVEYEY